MIRYSRYAHVNMLKSYLNMILTGYLRYDQIFTICLCEYVKIFHIFVYLCIYVHPFIYSYICAYMCIYVHICVGGQGRRILAVYLLISVYMCQYNICWYLCICANICVYLCIYNSGLREQRKIECMLFGGFVFLTIIWAFDDYMSRFLTIIWADMNLNRYTSIETPAADHDSFAHLY